MNDERDIGYTKDEYYQISARQGLPNRCPIFGKCLRALETRYEMGFKLGGATPSFETFLKTEGFEYKPEEMINTIEQMSWSYASDVFCSVDNVCPEVTLFEPKYLPNHFRQSAFGCATYYKESRSFVAEPKHFGECAEFSEYAFHNMGAIKLKELAKKNRKRSHISTTMRFEIFQRDDYRCHYCKRHKSQFPESIHLTLDHKVPHVDGGDDSFGNLVTACSECNNGKANKIINDP